MSGKTTSLYTILITGGTGLIGRALTGALLAQGHAVRHLGRSRTETQRTVPSFSWDPTTGTIDARSVRGVDVIIHLAGAGIADARWTSARIQELIDSRAGTARLLLRTVKAEGAPIRTFVSAAGINYHGAFTSDRIHVEADPPAMDTIGRISTAWEEAVDEWRVVTRTVKLRTPLVLSMDGGGLPRLLRPVRYGLGAALGTGVQWMPWVHIDDLVDIYMHAIEHAAVEGVYHVNTGHDVTNDEFMRTAARVLRRPYFLPRVPAWVLRIALGELSSILLHGSRASNERLLSTGYRFKHAHLEGALRSLLG